MSQEEENGHSETTLTKHFITVGIGASAGGIKALKEFFSLMPGDSGMAFVVVPHLSASHENNLASILQKETKMKVMQVNEARKVQPNEVYVMPPNKSLTMMDGTIELADEALRESEERFRKMADNAPVMIWVTDQNGGCTYLSRSWYEFTGQTPETGLAQGFAAAIHPDDRERDGKEFALAVEEKKEFRSEHRLQRSDGTFSWVICHARPRFARSGEFLGHIGSVVDISDRKANEERVRASEEQLRVITDSLPALVSYVDRDRKYRFVNRRYTQWFDRSAESIVGKTLAEVLGDAVADRLEPYIQRVLSGEKVSFETWLDYAGAGRRFVHVAYVPDLHSDGSANGFYALVSDFSDQRRAEERLRSSENRMRVLTDSFADYAIFSIDLNGLIDSWNPGAKNIFGYDESEIIGEPGQKLFTNEDVENGVPEQEMKKAEKFGRAMDERWHRRKDGSLFFASGVMAPLYDGDELTGFAKIVTDLTERRRQAEELQRAYDEMEMRVRERTKELARTNESLLEQINERQTVEAQRIQLLQRLVNTQEDERRRIARDLHDQLGQRMTGLRLKLASLDEKCAETPELSALTTRLKQLAEMLDSEIGFLAWELRPAALDELGLVAALETFVREWSRHFDIISDFHTSGTQKLRLTSEAETQVYRITQESLNNIAKHAQATQISVIFERIGEGFVLVIEDNGKGFEPESLQISETGHGLGLAGMRERAELIGGEVEIESKPGSGTTVFLRIPFAATLTASE